MKNSTNFGVLRKHAEDKYGGHWYVYNEALPFDIIVLAQDKENGDIYAGYFGPDEIFNGTHVKLNAWFTGPSERFVWRPIVNVPIRCDEPLILDKE